MMMYACRQSVESTRQYEMQRAANERLLEEKEALNRNLTELREEKSAVEQRLRNSEQDLSKAKVR
jgi:predicted  nucleic acid-binding Zn-ribbon protein